MCSPLTFFLAFKVSNITHLCRCSMGLRCPPRSAFSQCHSSHGRWRLPITNFCTTPRRGLVLQALVDITVWGTRLGLGVGYGHVSTTNAYAWCAHAGPETQIRSCPPPNIWFVTCNNAYYILYYIIYYYISLCETAPSRSELLHYNSATCKQ